MPAFGWLRNPLDPRDYRVSSFIPTMKIIPMVKYNLRPPITDQGNLGACVEHVFLELMQSEEIRRGDEFLERFSRRFAYQHYNEVVNGDPSADMGCMPRLAVRLLQRDGVCLEDTVPYVNYGQPMPPVAYEEALENQVLEYYTIPTNVERLSTLASDYNWGCGIPVFESFMDASNGQVPMPDIHKEALKGYHMIMIWGYDRNLNIYHCQNSWGEGWGDKGLFTIPFAYLDDPAMAGDWTVIKKVEE